MGRLLWSPANVGPLAICRQVLTIHDLASLEHPEWFEKSFAFWYRCLVPRLVRRVRRVITVSEFSKSRLLELMRIPESHIFVVPNGVDDRFYPRGDEEIRSVKEKIGISGLAYVLSVSSLEPRKNLARLLEAWAISAPRLPADVWLVVTGAQGKKNIFRTLNLERLPPRVVFTGFIADQDLPALYSGAIALVYPSIYEGFGLPALEAMASGTVPIVSNATALPEVVGDAGIMVDPFRTDDLAGAITRIVEDSELRKSISRLAVQRSHAFTWNHTAELTWQILSDAAAI
jgi:glycosyltransferase involved in cell wall biosynthesis